MSTLLVISGAYGIGKSSLIQAGLLSEVRGYSIENIRPGSTSSEKLVEISENSNSKNDQQKLIVIDQYEEILSSSIDMDQRTQFERVLIHLIKTQHAYTKIIVIVRSDFLERATPYEVQDLWKKNLYNIPGFRRDELAEIIEGPSKRAGLKLEYIKDDKRFLTDYILDEVEGEANSLPLLSVALSEMYDYHAKFYPLSYTIEKHSYESIGSLRGVLNRTANALYNALSESEMIVAKCIIIRLVRLESTALIKRVVRKSELDYTNKQQNEISEKIIQQFVQARLLHQFDNSIHLEVAHEALIHSWDMFKAVIHSFEIGNMKGIEALDFFRKLSDAAVSYQLDKAIDPENAQLWQDQPKKLYMLGHLLQTPFSFLNEAESDFIKGSQEKREYREAMKLSEQAYSAIDSDEYIKAFTLIKKFKESIHGRNDDLRSVINSFISKGLIQIIRSDDSFPVDYVEYSLSGNYLLFRNYHTGLVEIYSHNGTKICNIENGTNSCDLHVRAHISPDSKQVLISKFPNKGNYPYCISLKQITNPEKEIVLDHANFEKEYFSFLFAFSSDGNYLLLGNNLFGLNPFKKIAELDIKFSYVQKTDKFATYESKYEKIGFFKSINYEFFYTITTPYKNYEIDNCNLSLWKTNGNRIANFEFQNIPNTRSRVIISIDFLEDETGELYILTGLDNYTIELRNIKKTFLKTYEIADNKSIKDSQLDRRKELNPVNTTYASFSKDGMHVIGTNPFVGLVNFWNFRKIDKVPFFKRANKKATDLNSFLSFSLEMGFKDFKFSKAQHICFAKYDNKLVIHHFDENSNHTGSIDFYHDMLQNFYYDETEFILTISYNGTVKLWNIYPPKKLDKTVLLQRFQYKSLDHIENRIIEKFLLPPELELPIQTEEFALIKEPLREFTYKNPVVSAGFLPNKHSFFTVSNNQTSIFKVKVDQEPLYIKVKVEDEIISGAISPDASCFILCGKHTLFVYDDRATLIFKHRYNDQPLKIDLDVEVRNELNYWYYEDSFKEVVFNIQPGMQLKGIERDEVYDLLRNRSIIHFEPSKPDFLINCILNKVLIFRSFNLSEPITLLHPVDELIIDTAFVEKDLIITCTTHAIHCWDEYGVEKEDQTIYSLSSKAIALSPSKDYAFIAVYPFFESDDYYKIEPCAVRGYLYNLTTKEVSLFKYLDCHLCSDERVLSAAFSDDSEKIVITFKYRAPEVWRVKNGSFISELSNMYSASEKKRRYGLTTEYLPSLFMKDNRLITSFNLLLANKITHAMGTIPHVEYLDVVTGGKTTQIEINTEMPYAITSIKTLYENNECFAICSFRPNLSDNYRLLRKPGQNGIRLNKGQTLADEMMETFISSRFFTEKYNCQTGKKVFRKEHTVPVFNIITHESSSRILIIYKNGEAEWWNTVDDVVDYYSTRIPV